MTTRKEPAPLAPLTLPDRFGDGHEGVPSGSARQPPSRANRANRANHANRTGRSAASGDALPPPVGRAYGESFAKVTHYMLAAHDAHLDAIVYAARHRRRVRGIDKSLLVRRAIELFLAQYAEGQEAEWDLGPWPHLQ